ncbi:MAG: YjbQ family protein [Candidatus Omnitrophica bacterium]|nr:YjbQ family protein [Candidatus Omnitrophota bacterium]
MTTINVKSSRKDQIVDITSQVADAVRKSGAKEGICMVYVPHTTAAVTVNENADPDVKSDFLMGLGKIVPEGLDYSHMEGNSPSHIKASLTGISVSVIVDNGKLVLGTWQGIYFCEYDGPRTRKVHIKVLEG